jgi:hypothetical protein
MYIGLSNGDLYMRRDVGWRGGGSGTANKDVHFVVTKRTEDDFSLLSYPLLSLDCICLLVQYSIWSEKQIKEAFYKLYSVGWYK